MNSSYIIQKNFNTSFDHKLLHYLMNLKNFPFLPYSLSYFLYNFLHISEVECSKEFQE